MKPNMKLCPQCFEELKSLIRFCPVCGYSFFDSDKANSVKIQNTANNTQLILLTTIGTIAIIGLLAGVYYLGTQTKKTEAAQTNSISTPFPTATSTPANSTNTNIINTNSANVANANNAATPINKPVKKQETNTNTQVTEKKRSLFDGGGGGWVYFTQSTSSPGGFYYYYKSDSLINENNSTVSVWTKKYPMFPKDFAKQNEMTTAVDYVLEKVRIRCDAEQIYTISETYFDANGSSIDDKRRGFRSGETIVPGTVTEALKQTVCK